MSADLSSIIGIPGLDHLPTGRWPDQISFDPSHNIYLWSVSNNVQINALGHVHVAVFDQDGFDPYTMTLQLPVVEHLPGSGRIYFFYVPYCHLGDQLIFSQVAGSGNAINGLLTPHTFTLLGQKVLYVAIAINGNYIIHPFNGLTAPPPPSAALPPTMLYYLDDNEPGAPGSFEIDTYGFEYGYGLHMTTLTPSQGFDNIVSGMEGFLTENVQVDILNLAGFRCEQSGWYHVHFSDSWRVEWTDPNVPSWCYPLRAFFREWNGAFNTNTWEMSGGGMKDYWWSPPTEGGMICQFSAPAWVYMQQGRVYTWEVNYNADGDPLAVSTSTHFKGYFTFQYYGPGVAPGPPLVAPMNKTFLKKPKDGKPIPPESFSYPIGLSKPPPSQDSKKEKSDIIMGTKEDTRSKRIEKQMKSLKEKDDKKKLDERERDMRMDISSSSSSSSSSGGGGVTLSDIEKVVGQMMAIKERKKMEKKRLEQITSSSSSSSSSSIPVVAAPVAGGESETKKRKRV